MSKLLGRLERLESGTHTKYPWEAVCRECAEQGLTETPYEHCEAKRCDAGKRAWADRLASHHDLPGRMREAWEISCRMKGEDPDERTRQLVAEDEAKQAAWNAKKRQARERGRA